MQNQGTSSLQQQKSDLQQGTPNLQQSGTPTSTLNTSTVLSEKAPNGELRVATSTTTAPSTVQPDVAQPAGSNIWLLVIIPVVIVISILSLRKSAASATVPETREVLKPVMKTASAKPKKKTQKRKKSGRR